MIMSEEEQKEHPNKLPGKHPGILSVLQSVLAAMFGVQSDEKRKKDFESGNAGSYILVGIVMTAVFIFSIIAIVNYILQQHAQA